MKLIIFTSFLLVGCSKINAPQEIEIKREYYLSGELKSMTKYDDDKNGEVITYYRDGAIRGSFMLVNNKINGKAIGFDRDGSHTITAHFLDDSLHGYVAVFADSVIKFDGYYNMGVIDGKWTNYLLNGKVFAEYSYKNGKLVSIDNFVGDVE